MNRDAILELRALEDRHWWFRGRRAAIAPHVALALSRAARGVVLDLGCGTGANLAWLARRAPGRTLVGLEPEPLALELARGRGLAAHWLRADGALLPLRDASAALVVCCDVLEHLADDAAACREIARVLAPGGTLVATVPAGPGLWSPHDVALGHRRRYARGELEQRLREAGLAVESAHGYVWSAWPLVWLLRRWRGRRAAHAPTTDFAGAPGPLGGALGAALAAGLGLESACLRSAGLRRGVSLVVRARRA